ncbi:MAG: M14 family zinc carboxypeptidase [Planctomycetota bacterium]
MVCRRWERGRRRSGAIFVALVVAGAAAADPTIERQVIGYSPAGEPIAVWTLADHDSTEHSPSDQPALAVIAGVQGHHAIGVHVAEAMGQLLIEEHAGALAGRTVYIVPRVNPEGIARFTSTDRPRARSGRAPEPRDADRDRRIDEDPPNDLNDDGLITMMRVPAPNTAFRIQPTHVIDAKDPRLVREPEDDESATHALLIEGLDDDGDGRFNEDGWGGASGGGVDLDRHFPMHWPEHTDGAGRFPLDRPEARALVEWLQSRGNISAVIVLGPHDTITSTPPTDRSGPDGRTPKGIEKDDSKAYAAAKEAFEKITGITQVEPGPNRSGSLVQWCYADLGVYTFGTPVWVRPDLVKPVEPTEEEAEAPGEAEAEGETEDAAPTPEQIEEADRADLAERGVAEMFIDFLYMTNAERAEVQAQIESMDDAELQDIMQQFAALPADVQSRLTAVRGGNQDPGPSDELIASLSAASIGDATPAPRSKSEPPADARWLAWIDERAQGGFVEWQPFDHPQLGSVEIGGFEPGVRVNPPEAYRDKLAEQQAEFAAAVLDMLPRVQIGDPTVERVGGGIWRIGLTITNTGDLPTKSAIGVKARRLPGMICVLDPDQELQTSRIVSGSRIIRFDVIEGRGASERAEWLVVATQGESIGLEVRSPLLGTQRYTLNLEAE